jgi:hypothetical protein
LRTDKAARAFIHLMHCDIRQLSVSADPPVTISEALNAWRSWWGHAQYCGNATADMIWRISEYIDLMLRRHDAGQDACCTDEEESESEIILTRPHAGRV